MSWRDHERTYSHEVYPNRLKRTELQRKTPLRQTSSLNQRSPLVKDQASSFNKRRPISPASKEQREKVKNQPCRNCGEWHVDPAHIVSRGLGGCDDTDCVLPLCRSCHRLFDGHDLDVLPLLTFDEQAHAASHVGLLGALKRTTNVDWVEA